MGKKKGGVRVKQVGPKMPAMMGNPMDDFQIPVDQMVQLPPTPDRSYQILWPIHESFNMKIDDFQVIYPSYIDGTKTTKKGRRISLDRAVIPSPTVADMSMALQLLKVRHVLQPYKGYSRDITCQWDNPGRCLVDVSTYKKRELMDLMAKHIPTLPQRQERLAREAEEKRKKDEEIAKAKEEAALAAKAKAAVAGTKKKNKKGKKK